MTKKILSVLITVSMVLNLFAAISSASGGQSTDAYTVSGPDAVLCPVLGGVSKVTYKLIDSEGNALEAKWSSDDIYITEDGYMLLSQNTAVGDCTVTANYNGVSYDKTVKVSAGAGSDFEDEQDGAAFVSGKSVYAADDSGSIYAKRTDGTNFYYITPPEDVINARGQVVIETEVRTERKSYGEMFGVIHHSGSAWSGGYHLKVNDGKYSIRYSDYAESATTPAYREAATDIPSTDWINVKMVYNYRGEDQDYLVDVYVEDVLVFDDVVNLSIGGTGTKSTGIRNTYVITDLNKYEIYTGKKVTPQSEPELGAKINGSDELKKPRKDEGYTVDYSVSGYFGTLDVQEWSISPEDDGITVSSDGELTVTKDASAGGYILSARLSDAVSVSKSIKVSEGDYAVAVTGPEKIEIAPGVTEGTYEYILADQLGEKDGALWSVSGDDANITINAATGVLTVKNGAPEGTYVISAVSEVDGLTYTKTVLVEYVTVPEVTYSIDGSSTLLKPGSDFISAVQYNLCNDKGEAVTQGVTWSTTNAEILDDGRVLIDSSSPETINIIAEYEGKKYSFPVKTITGVSEDFEGYAVGSFLNKPYGEIKRDSSDPYNKTNYCYISETVSGLRVTMQLNLKGAGKDLTLSYDCYADPGESYGGPIFTNPQGQWLETISYTCAQNGSDRVYTFNAQDYNYDSSGNETVTAKSGSVTVGAGEWVHVDLKFNTAGNCFDIYANSQKIIENVKIQKWNQESLNIDKIIWVGIIDNIDSYSGKYYDRTVSILTTEDIAVNNTGATAKEFASYVTEDGAENPYAQVIWTVEDSENITGDISKVYFEGSKLIIAEPVFGDIYIKAGLKDSPVNSGLQKITLRPAFSGYSDGVLTAGGNEGDLFEVKIYPPASGNFIDSATGSSDTAEISSHTARSDGTVSINLPFDSQGLYLVVITNESGLSEEYEIAYECDKIFEQPDVKELLSYEKAEQYLEKYASLSKKEAEEYTALYRRMTSKQKDKVIAYSGRSIEKLYDAVILTAFLSGNSEVLETVKNRLCNTKIKSKSAELLASGEWYSTASQSILNGDYNFEEAFEQMRNLVVLHGINAESTYYKDIHKYLELMESDKYNNASSENKNKIAKHIFGEQYDDYSDIVSAVKKLNLSAGDSSGGSSGGAGSSKSKSSGGLYTPAAPVNSGSIADGNNFTDVSEAFWAYSCITDLAGRNILSGYPDSTFRPDANITRAEFIKCIALSSGIPSGKISSFNDVGVGDWFMPYVSGCEAAGLAKGSGGNFYPNAKITREDAAVLTYRTLLYRNIDDEGEVLGFADNYEIADYAREAVGKLSYLGVVNGIGNNMFAPKANLTRAEAAKLIYELVMMEGEK